MEIKKNILYYVNVAFFILWSMYMLFTKMVLSGIDVSLIITLGLVTLVALGMAVGHEKVHQMNLLENNALLKAIVEVVVVVGLLAVSFVVRANVAGNQIPAYQLLAVLACMLLSYGTARFFSNFAVFSMVGMLFWPVLMSRYAFSLESVMKIVVIYAAVFVTAMIFYMFRDLEQVQQTGIILFVLIVVMVVVINIMMVGNPFQGQEFLEVFLDFERSFSFEGYDKYYYLSCLCLALIGAIRMWHDRGSYNCIVVFLLNVMLFVITSYGAGSEYTYIMIPFLGIVGTSIFGINDFGGELPTNGINPYENMSEVKSGAAFSGDGMPDIITEKNFKDYVKDNNSFIYSNVMLPENEEKPEQAQKEQKTATAVQNMEEPVVSDMSNIGGAEPDKVEFELDNGMYVENASGSTIFTQAPGEGIADVAESQNRKRSQIFDFFEDDLEVIENPVEEKSEIEEQTRISQTDERPDAVVTEEEKVSNAIEEEEPDEELFAVMSKAPEEIEQEELQEIDELKPIELIEKVAEENADENEDALRLFEVESGITASTEAEIESGEKEAETEPEEAEAAEIETEPEEASAVEIEAEPEEAEAVEIEAEPEETSVVEIIEAEPEEAAAVEAEAAEIEAEPEETEAEVKIEEVFEADAESEIEEPQMEESEIFEADVEFDESELIELEDDFLDIEEEIEFSEDFIKETTEEVVTSVEEANDEIIVDSTKEESVEEMLDEPTEETVEAIVEEPVEEFMPEELEEPLKEVDEITEEPVEEIVEELEEIEEPIREETVKAPIATTEEEEEEEEYPSFEGFGGDEPESAKETTETIAEEPVIEEMKEIVEESPVEEMIDEPTEETVEAIIEEPVEEFMPEELEEPLKEVDEITEEPVEEIVEELKEIEEPVREETAKALIATTEEEEEEYPSFEGFGGDEPESVEETTETIAEEPVIEEMKEIVEESPVEETIDEPTEETVEAIVEEPVEEFMPEEIEEPLKEIDEIIEGPVEENVEELEEIEEPVREETAKAPIATTEEEEEEYPSFEGFGGDEPESAEETTETIAEEPVIEEMKEIVEESPVEETIDESTEETIEAIAEEPVEEFMPEEIEEPVREETAKDVAEKVDEVTEESAEIRTEESIEEKVNEITENQVVEEVEEPVVDVVEEVKETVQTTISKAEQARRYLEEDEEDEYPSFGGTFGLEDLFGKAEGESTYSFEETKPESQPESQEEHQTDYVFEEVPSVPEINIVTGGESQETPVIEVEETKEEEIRQSEVAATAEIIEPETEQQPSETVEASASTSLPVKKKNYFDDDDDDEFNFPSFDSMFGTDGFDYTVQAKEEEEKVDIEEAFPSFGGGSVPVDSALGDPYFDWSKVDADVYLNDETEEKKEEIMPEIKKSSNDQVFEWTPEMIAALEKENQ